VDVASIQGLLTTLQKHMRPRSSGRTRTGSAVSDRAAVRFLACAAVRLRELGYGAAEIAAPPADREVVVPVT